MDRTPSPPRRVRTPPAPLHGPRYDNYEPFSPRRSSRVAAQNNSHSRIHQEEPTTSPTRSKRSIRVVTPTNSSRKSIDRTAHFALSPPSSPVSPAKARSPRSTRRTQHETGTLDSDSDHFAPTPARRLFPSLATQGMLPTPSKTPRKRALETEESLRPTARVLFENRPSTLEDHMPTPRKAHRSMRTALDLESFEEGSTTPKIGVYVDSKERIPDRKDEESNPFVTRRGKGKAKATPRKPRKMDEEKQKIFDAAARDEGIVYTHRGKTIIRKFTDVDAHSDSVDAARSSDDEVYRRASRDTDRRITRSSIQPKLLFKEEIERLKRENGEEEDEEEADTDIEIPIATPSRRTRHIGPSASFPQDSTATVPKAKRQTSFEAWSGSWRRVKSTSSSSTSARAGTKRSGEPLEQPADKRARSEHSSASSFASV